MFISIDEHDSRPIYQQIVNQIREQVSRELLNPGDELPSVRELSDSLGINLHTVRRAYLELRDQGIIDLRLGRRAKISNAQHRVVSPDNREQVRLRMKELITDALLSGYSPEEIEEMVIEHLKNSRPEEHKA